MRAYAKLDVDDPTKRPRHEQDYRIRDGRFAMEEVERSFQAYFFRTNFLLHQLGWVGMIAIEFTVLLTDQQMLSSTDWYWSMFIITSIDVFMLVVRASLHGVADQEWAQRIGSGMFCTYIVIEFGLNGLAVLDPANCEMYCGITPEQMASYMAQYSILTTANGVLIGSHGFSRKTAALLTAYMMTSIAVYATCCMPAAIMWHTFGTLLGAGGAQVYERTVREMFRAKALAALYSAQRIAAQEQLASCAPPAALHATRASPSHRVVGSMTPNGAPRPVPRRPVPRAVQRPECADGRAEHRRWTQRPATPGGWRARVRGAGSRAPRGASDHQHAPLHQAPSRQAHDASLYRWRCMRPARALVWSMLSTCSTSHRIARGQASWCSR